MEILDIQQGKCCVVCYQKLMSLDCVISLLFVIVAVVTCLPSLVSAQDLGIYWMRIGCVLTELDCPCMRRLGAGITWQETTEKRQEVRTKM